MLSGILKLHFIRSPFHEHEGICCIPRQLDPLPSTHANKYRRHETYILIKSILIIYSRCISDFLKINCKTTESLLLTLSLRICYIINLHKRTLKDIPLFLVLVYNSVSVKAMTVANSKGS